MLEKKELCYKLDMNRTSHYKLNKINFDKTIALSPMLLMLCQRSIKSINARNALIKKYQKHQYSQCFN